MNRENIIQFPQEACSKKKIVSWFGNILPASNLYFSSYRHYKQKYLQIEQEKTENILSHTASSEEK